MSPTVASGTMTYSGTTAGPITFGDRFDYVAITNTGTALMYATADGSTASATNGVAIPVGDTAVLANGLPYWNQTRNVIVPGSIQIGNGMAYQPNTADANYNQSTATRPGTVTPMSALDGGSANPGTSVSLFGSGLAYTIAAAG